VARQVPVLQGPQEAAQADRRRRRGRRAAEQAPARGGRRLPAGDDRGGGRVRRPPRRRARQVQRLLPREGGGVRHPAEGNCLTATGSFDPIHISFSFLLREYRSDSCGGSG
jgi:hypothetical protein